MRFLIFVSLVAISTAQSVQYEPEDDDPLCLICKDPLVCTFDKTFLTLEGREKKYLLANWDDNIEDKCKFQVRGVTSFDYFGDSLDGPENVWLDWIGISLHVHKKATKEFRNWLLAQHVDKLGERGQGFGSGLVVRDLTDGLNDDSWFFPYLGEDVTKKEFFRKVKCNPQYVATNKGDHIQIRSFCCDWALNWYPDGRNTCVEIFIKPGSQYEGKMKGICGNADGDRLNDWEGCTGTMCGPSIDCFLTISDGCISGKHNGNAFVGGKRI